MTLKQAVRKLGGASQVASIVGVPRTSIIYWMNSKRPPKWRKAEIAQIIALAVEQEAA